MQGWFIARPTGPSHSLTTWDGFSVGVACAEFQHPGQSGFLDPDHGQLFDNGLSQTVGADARYTLCEGFTDCEEDAAQFRVRNIDPNGLKNPVTEPKRSRKSRRPLSVRILSIALQL
jgi:hypothetical protein